MGVVPASSSRVSLADLSNQPLSSRSLSRLPSLLNSLSASTRSIFPEPFSFFHVGVVAPSFSFDELIEIGLVENLFQSRVNGWATAGRSWVDPHRWCFDCRRRLPIALCFCFVCAIDCVYGGIVLSVFLSLSFFFFFFFLFFFFFFYYFPFLDLSFFFSLPCQGLRFISPKGGRSGSDLVEIVRSDGEGAQARSRRPIMVSEGGRVMSSRVFLEDTLSGTYTRWP